MSLKYCSHVHLCIQHFGWLNWVVFLCKTSAWSEWWGCERGLKRMLCLCLNSVGQGTFSLSLSHSLTHSHTHTFGDITDTYIHYNPNLYQTLILTTDPQLLFPIPPMKNLPQISWPWVWNLSPKVAYERSHTHIHTHKGRETERVGQKPRGTPCCCAEYQWAKKGGNKFEVRAAAVQHAACLKCTKQEIMFLDSLQL